MLDFSALKKNSALGREELSKKIKEQNSSYKKDDRFWEPTKDKVGNAYTVIRFLPAPKGEDLPYVKIFRHAFKNKAGKWYIENSLTTLGQDDPVYEYNAKMYESGLESNKKIVEEFTKRTTSFISNIYVVSDPSNPENEGKVFLYRYGKKIFSKIQLALNPEFADETPFNPFDFWEGANFKLKIRKVDGQTNYDSSTFETECKPLGDDKMIEAVWEQEHSLSEQIDPKNFKSYDALKKRFNEVWLHKPTVAKDESQNESDGDGVEAEVEEEPHEVVETPSTQVEEEEEVDEEAEKAFASTEDDDEIPQYFMKMSNKLKI